MMIQDTVHFQSRIRSMFQAKFVAHYQNYFDCDLGFQSQMNLMNRIFHQLNWKTLFKFWRKKPHVGTILNDFQLGVPRESSKGAFQNRNNVCFFQQETYFAQQQKCIAISDDDELLILYLSKIPKWKLNDSICNRYISNCYDITWGIDFYVTNISHVIFMVLKKYIIFGNWIFQSLILGLWNLFNSMRLDCKEQADGNACRQHLCSSCKQQLITRAYLLVFRCCCWCFCWSVVDPVLLRRLSSKILNATDNNAERDLIGFADPFNF